MNAHRTHTQPHRAHTANYTACKRKPLQDAQGLEIERYQTMSQTSERMNEPDERTP